MERAGLEDIIFPGCVEGPRRIEVRGEATIVHQHNPRARGRSSRVPLKPWRAIRGGLPGGPTSGHKCPVGSLCGAT